MLQSTKKNQLSFNFAAKYSANGYHLLELDSYSEAMEFVNHLRGTNQDYVFRGQSNASFPLESSLTRLLKREEESNREQLRREHLRYALFELRGRVEFQGDLAQCLDDLAELRLFSTSSSSGQHKFEASGTQMLAELWAFGQHHGLATPLLDWTLAPGVGLFFAVEKPIGSERHMAGFYALNRTLISDRRPNPKIGSLDFVTPIRFANPRLSAQRGLFTLCSRDIPIETWINEAFRDERDAPALFKLIFPLTEQDRRACLRKLRDQNITHSSIYPDVAGAANHANVLLEERLERIGRDTRKAASEPDEAIAELDLEKLTLWLRAERDSNSRLAAILEGKLLQRKSRKVLPQGWERWNIKRVSIEGIDLKNRAGCAYRIDYAGPLVEKQQPLFLKTPDTRHFDHHRLADIRRSFEEEKSSLAALATEGESQKGLEPLKVARVLASFEIGFAEDSPQVRQWSVRSFPALLHDYVDQIPLDKALDKLGRPLSPKEWFSLAHSLTNTLRRVHNRSVLHAAIAPRHVLVDSINFQDAKVCAKLNEAVLVGFGSASLLNAAAQNKRQHPRPRLPWIAPEVHENEDLLGPLSFSTDVYSLGLTLLYAATRNPKPKASNPPKAFELPRHPLLLKRSVTKLLEDFNEGIAACHDIAKIIDKCLRYDPHDRYSCMEELVDAVHSAQAEKASGEKNLVKALEMVSAQLTGRKSYFGKDLSIPKVPKKTKWKMLNPFFQQLLQRQVDRVKDEVVDKLTHGHYEVYGHRDTLIDYLCSFMNLLKQGQTYCTVSLPGYWTDINLGSDGRFLAKNKELLNRGVNVERVFLVSGPFVELPFAEQRVLLAHYESWIALPPDQREKFRVRIAERKSEELMSFEKRGQAVAIIETERSNETGVALRFLSTGSRYQHAGQFFINRQIRKLRFQELNSKKLQEEKERMAFKAHFDSGVDLAAYVQPRNSDSLRSILISE